MNKYTKGQILIDKDGSKRKVLEVLGDLVFIYDNNVYGKEFVRTCDYKEIDQNYTIEKEKWKPTEGSKVWRVFIGEKQKANWFYWDSLWHEQLLALNLVFKTEEEALERYQDIINKIKEII